MSWVTFILGTIVLTSASILLLKICIFVKHYKKDVNFLESEKAKQFIEAKKIFVRDPEHFKDIDKDGIDDIIDVEK